jgi:Domain of unknown function (DUF4279)
VGEADDSKSPSKPPGGSGEEKIRFAYSADLRIFGSIPDLDEITKRLGVAPTHTHRKGDRAWGTTAYEHDMWGYHPPLKETEPLHVHIDTLWITIREHKEYLLQLKQSLTVDVFLGYRSSCDNAGVEVPYQSLEMFRELQVPFGLSIIVA